MKKLAVITGGTKGIGKALVLKFASQGFDIITCARNENGLESLAQDVAEINPNSLFFPFVTDLSVKKNVLEFSKYVQKLHRPVDVLINNTGVFAPGKVTEEADGMLEKLIETNLYSAYHLTRALQKEVITSNDGYIFNICSTASIQPYINGGSYCISKYALLGFTKVLREELKEQNVRVSAVLPGATFTSSWEGAPFPPERFIKPEDVAEIIFSSYQLSKQAVIEEILIRPQLGDI